MTVVYLDSVLVLNTLMDYVLFLATARLAGIPLRRGRYLMAALAGGAYAAAVFLPGGGFLAEPMIKAAAGVLLALIAYGGERKLLRLTLLLFLLSFALAGCVLALGLLAGDRMPVVGGIFYTDVSWGILLTAATAAYLLLSVVFRASAKQGIQGHLLPVRVCVDGRTVEFTALWDSGNGLTDGETGRPILVADWEVLAHCLPWMRRADLLELETFLQRRPDLLPRLVAYRSVGVDGGVLLSFRSEWTEIGGKRYEKLRIALSPGMLGEGYFALWGGDGGVHIEDDGISEKSFDMAGTAAGRRSPLHWRQ